MKNEKAGIKNQEAKKETSLPQKQNTNRYQPGNEQFDHALYLQRNLGNQAVQRLMESAPSREKLKIEQLEEEPVKGSGQPLAESTRDYFEPRFRTDFSQVRLHTDSRAAEAAKSVNAKAFTLGKNVVFGAGQYTPGTSTGKRLLAHELTHVVQQKQGSVKSTDQVIQKVDWSEDEAPPMHPTEFRSTLISQVLHLSSRNSPAIPDRIIGDYLDPATGNTDLISYLDGVVRRSIGLRADGQWDLLDEAANRLVTDITRIFILDPNMSSLDLLSARQTRRFKNFAWGHEDYPGGDPAGANERRAEQLAGALSGIRPQRRVNRGTDAVVTRGEYTTAIETHILTNLQDIPAFPNAPGAAHTYTQPAGHRLYNDARASLVRMRDDAYAEGVPIIVIDSYRDPAVARARAEAEGNPAAVASYSPHSLGLAVDLRMSVTYQDAADATQTLTYRETTTRPMQNVVDMRQSPVHKWLFLHGADYGWYPYQNEPWHWEYNPPGFRAQFLRAAGAAP